MSFRGNAVTRALSAFVLKRLGNDLRDTLATVLSLPRRHGGMGHPHLVSSYDAFFRWWHRKSGEVVWNFLGREERNSPALVFVQRFQDRGLIARVYILGFHKHEGHARIPGVKTLSDIFPFLIDWRGYGYFDGYRETVSL